jgi:hypothetical protein
MKTSARSEYLGNRMIGDSLEHPIARGALYALNAGIIGAVIRVLDMGKGYVEVVWIPVRSVAAAGWLRRDQP